MTSTTQPIIALAIKHGASSYTNRADTQHPAYGFTEAALTAFAQDLLAGQCLHQQIAEPQPEALRLAEALEKDVWRATPMRWAPVVEMAATKLRAQHARIAELESQLHAIGAGGVEPLRKPAAKAVQAAVPEGWKLVPIKPTPEMCHVGRYGGDKDAPAYGEKSVEGATAWPFVADHTAEQIYQSMLAAAPAHPAEGVPAQAVSAEVDLPDVEDMAHSALQEALSFGLGHDVLNRWMRKVMTQTQAALAATQPEPAIFGDEDHVLVPRGLISAACYAIDKKRDGTKTLAELRRYTTGDLSAASQPAAVPVAHRVLRKNTITGDWTADGRYWDDGAPAAELIAETAKMAGQWRVECAYTTQPAAQGMDRQKIDPLRQMLAQHEAHLEQNPYAYFELAYTRRTGWMVWITDKPAFRESVLVNPDRKVLWQGQGDTPDEACENAALAAQAKQGGAA